MDSYCYGLVKGVAFRAKVCFYRNKINAMSIPNRNPEIHDKIILKMLSRIWKFYEKSIKSHILIRSAMHDFIHAVMF